MHMHPPKYLDIMDVLVSRRGYGETACTSAAAGNASHCAAPGCVARYGVTVRASAAAGNTSRRVAPRCVASIALRLLQTSAAEGRSARFLFMQPCTIMANCAGQVFEQVGR